MEEVVHFNELYDLYRELLTDRQREIFEYYFFDNLSLEEIASNDGVSKSSVAKTVKQVKETLEDLERKLHSLDYRNKVKKEFENEPDILNRLAKYDNIES